MAIDPDVQVIIDDLQTTIDSLQAQIAALEAQITNLPAGGDSGLVDANIQFNLALYNKLAQQADDAGKINVFDIAARAIAAL